MSMLEDRPYVGKKFFGKYRGIVKENEDPDKLGRIRALVPSVLGEKNFTSWAYPVFPIDYFGVPSVGVTIYVEFEAGHIDRPLYSGSWYGVGDKAYTYNSRIAGNDDVTLSRGKGDDSVNPGAAGKIDEPDDPYEGKYPKVRQFSVAGLIIEIDSSNEDGTRINIHHPTGKFIEMHPDGSVVSKTTSEYAVIDDNKIVHIGGDLKVLVEGKGNAQYGDDSTLDIDGNVTVKIAGKLDLEIEGSCHISAKDFTFDGGGGPYGQIVTTKSICPYTGANHAAGSAKVGCSS